MDFSYNLIFELDNDKWDEFIVLKSLNLSYNKNLDKIPVILLKNSHITILNLKNINMKYSHFQNIEG